MLLIGSRGRCVYGRGMYKYLYTSLLPSLTPPSSLPSYLTFCFPQECCCVLH